LIFVCSLKLIPTVFESYTFAHLPVLILFDLVVCGETVNFLQNKYNKTKAKLDAQTQVQIKRMSALRKIDLSMTTTMDLKTTLMIIIDQALTQVKVTAANIYLLNQDSQNLEWLAGEGYPTIRKVIPKTQHPAIADLENEKTIYTMQLADGSAQNELTNEFSAAGFAHLLVFPLQYHNVLLGTMEILNSAALPSDEDFTSYLETLAGQAAIAIEHDSSFANLQYMNTHLQETIKELIETKDVLEKSQKIGHIGSWRYKTKTGKVFWSEELYEIYGISPNETQLTYETIFEFMLPEDKERIRQNIEKLFQGEIIAELEYRICHPDGNIRHLITMCEAFRNDKQKITEIIGTVRDRTEHKQAELVIRQAHLNLQQTYDTTLEGWARALDLRDHGTEGHAQRVTQLSLQLAEILEIPDEDRINIRRGALLHDIGKIGIPDTILLKPGKLSAEEWVIMRKHPQFAYDLLSPIDYLHPALDIPFCHHEKWDGSGYPQGLKGKEIPLSARIFAIVDVLDALCSDRPYRKAWPLNKAKSYVMEQSGTHFDPLIVQTLQENWNRIKL
jgi:PAS domain S-box-containing protein